MAAPDIILHRWITLQRSRHPEFAGYVGKLDLEKVQPYSRRSFLAFVQDAMNAALRLENANASGGVDHPPYHFDYIDVENGARNAHAFQHKGFSFVVVTLPLVDLLWRLSDDLSVSVTVYQLMNIDPNIIRNDAVRALFFQFQLLFLISHEYTHHVHEHCSRQQTPGIWTEFRERETGGLESQAQEIDADGYSIYLVLENFLRGGGRQGALVQLQRQNLSGIEGDDLLLAAFFIALISLFCALWPDDVRTESVYDLGHPPAPVRIEYAIRIAQMWCAQNGSLPDAWFSAERFNSLFLAAVRSVHGNTPSSWDAHVKFLQSAAGKKYDRLLLERFEAIRKRAAKSVLGEAASA